MRTTNIKCPNCSKTNRIPVAAQGKPKCGNCGHHLPWIVDALDDDFAEVAEQADVPVLVDMWATWCGPCRMVSPVLDQLAHERAGDIKLVRVDVDQSGSVAPGGGRIGMDAAEIQALYPGQVEERPHKYVEGALYLRVVPDDSPSVLVFEVSPEGKVQRWRVGVPPQADYVEGCS